MITKDKKQEIIKESNNKLKELPNLVRNLSNLSGLKEDRENYSNSYSKNT